MSQLAIQLYIMIVIKIIISSFFLLTVRAEKAEDKIPKRELKNTNQSNLAA